MLSRLLSRSQPSDSTVLLHVLFFVLFVAFYYFMDKVIQYIAFYSMNIPFFACHFYCEDVCCFHHLAVTNKAEPINFRIFTESVSESVDNIIIYSGVLSYAIFFKIIALLRYNSSN